jgi:hypothetical protein
MFTDKHGWFECFAKQFLKSELIPFSSVFIPVFLLKQKPHAPEFAAIGLF